jgi:hypothetical protein
VRNELNRSLPLLTLFAVGLAAGVWIFLSPWALGYPMPGRWTASVWTCIWVGALLVAASAVSLVVVLARALHVVLAQARAGA